MDYGNILRRSWTIVWHNKFMFLLGFLAALGSGGSGGSGGNSNFNVSSSELENNDFNLPPGIVENLERYWQELAGLFVAFLCLLIIIGLIFWLLSLVGQAGLINSASRIDGGEKVTFSQAFTHGVSKLGSMVGLNLILYGPFILIGIATFAVAAALVGPSLIAEFSGNPGSFNDVTGALGGFFLCFAVLACLLVPLGILVNIIYPFAARGLILQGLGAMESVRHGWKVLRQNVGDILILIVIFIVLGIGFGIVAAIILVPLGLLLLGPTIITMISGSSIGVVNILLLIVGGIVLGTVAALINSIMIAYRSTVVTLAYEEFLNKSV